MAGVVDSGDVGIGGRVLELTERPLELQIADVVLRSNNGKTALLELGRHGLGVPRRTRKGGRMLIGGIADHEGDAFIGEGSVGPKKCACHSQDKSDGRW